MTNTNNILRWTVISGLFLTLLVPFIVSKDLFFPFITGKAFTFRILIEVLSVPYIFLLLNDPESRPRKTPILLAISFFMTVMIVTDIFGINVYRSFWSNFERMEGFISYTHLFVYFLMLSTVFKTEKIWFWFLNSSIGASVLMGVYAIMQMAGKISISQSDTRVDGRFGNATYLAAYMLFHFFLTSFFLFRRKGNQKWARAGYIIAILIQLTAMFGTATRGAILGTIVGVVVSCIFLVVRGLVKKEKDTAWKISAGILAGVVLLAGTFISIRNTSFVRNNNVLVRFANISLHEQTTESRLIIWGMGMKGWMEHPILGWGQENFNVVFNKYYDPRLWPQEAWFDRAHNIFLDWLISGGIPGLLTYLGIYGAAVYAVMRTKKHFSHVDKAVFLGLLTSYMASNFFVFDNLVSLLLFFAVLAFLGFNLRAHEIHDKSFAGHYDNDSIMHQIAAAVGVILVIWSLYFVNIKPLLAARSLLSALSPQVAGADVNLEYFKKAISYNTFGSPEASEHLLQMASSANVSDQVSDGLKKKFAETATLELVKRENEDPNDPRKSLFLGMYLLRIGKPDEAFIHLNKALALSPKKQMIFFEIANAYLMKKDYAGAVEAFRKAYELDVHYPDARSAYAAGSIYVGHPEIVGEIIKADPKELGFLNDSKVIGAYSETKQWSALVDIYKMKISNDPSNIQSYVSLAATYVNMGDRANAVSVLERAVKINSDFRETGDRFISDIRAGRMPE